MRGCGTVAPLTGAACDLPYTVGRWVTQRTMAFVMLALIGGVLAPTWSRASDVRPINERLTGAWTFVSSINTRTDGSRFDRWGPNPSGILIFDGNGHYSQMITSRDRIFGAKTVASFGQYSVDEVNRTISIKIESSTSPHATGTIQQRMILSLNEDELRYLIPVTTGGNTAEVVWKRLKEHASVK